MEKYALYDRANDRIVELADTQAEIQEAYKMSKVFRRMVNQEPLEMVKVSLTEEEYEEFYR